MEKAFSATQARKQFFKLLTAAGRGAHVKITFEGHPPVVLVSEREWEGLIETLEVMSDPVLMRDIRQGIREMKQGKGIPLEELEKKLGL
jgi:prevent-host-death family protein